MTHVSERSGAGSNGAEDQSGERADRRPWTSAGRTGRKRTVTYADAGVSIHAGEKAVELALSTDEAGPLVIEGEVLLRDSTD